METATSSPTATSSTSEACMPAKPQEEHLWLQKLLGEWTFESECAAEPGQPNQKFRGSEHTKALGDLWIIGEGEGDMPGGGRAKMLITLGYDPNRRAFVGSWLGSMMTHLWVYEGQLDEAKRVLTLSAQGPSFTDPNKLAKYQDIIEIISDDHRTLTSRTQGEDGQWTQFMSAHYRRRK